MQVIPSLPVREILERKGREREAGARPTGGGGAADVIVDMRSPSSSLASEMCEAWS